MATKIIVGRGKAKVELDGELHAAVDRVIRQCAPTLLDELDGAVNGILDGARSEWPVGKERTGAEKGRPHSKDLFSSGVRIVSPERVEGFIDNSADYSYKIKTKVRGVDASPWQVLVVRPVRETSSDLAERLAGELAALVASGGR